MLTPICPFLKVGDPIRPKAEEREPRRRHNREAYRVTFAQHVIPQVVMRHH